MNPVEIKGIIPALITPMNEDESLNLKELRNQVNRMIESGCHGIFCLGTNGEGYILDTAEKIQVLEAVVDECNGRVPVYAGTGVHSTKETIRLSRTAMDIGADVLSLVTPGFAAASQSELFTHYETIAKAVDMPIVLYNIPARTGNALDPATVGRLAELENIVGIKDSSGNFVNLLSYLDVGRRRKQGGFAVLSGNDQLIIWTLMAGGAGGIAGCANVYPRTLASVYDLFIDGKIEEAKAMNAAVQTLRGCFKYGNPNTIVKTAVALLGYPVGKCRAPFNQVPADGIEALKKALAESKEKGMA